MGLQAKRLGADYLAAYFDCLLAEMHFKQAEPDEADEYLTKATAVTGGCQRAYQQTTALAKTFCIEKSLAQQSQRL